MQIESFISQNAQSEMAMSDNCFEKSKQIHEISIEYILLYLKIYLLFYRFRFKCGILLKISIYLASPHGKKEMIQSSLYGCIYNSQ